jgi:para-aminobenzoate synthetase component 1
VSLFSELLATRGPAVILESTGGAPSLARLSMLARHPRAMLVADRETVRIATPSGCRSLDCDPFAALRWLLREVPAGRWPDEGGVVGALAYDFARPRREPEPTPLLIAMAFDRFQVSDGETASTPLPHVAYPDLGLDDAPAETPPRAISGLPPLHSPLALPSFSNLTRNEYRALVLRIQEHIARGDIYQANLSQRFELPWPQTGLDLYRSLRTVSPAPFAGYFRAAGIEIVSASPERLLQVSNGEASTRPIAGTRPRSSDAASDRALAAELILSEKERAEHLMLVDLARNDLGKVAALGSVEVDELMTVEDYAQVRHIVSNVRARLAPGRDAFDALLAMFPGGTITGVPKIRCMQILDGLEPAARGFYTGALFYATPSGRLDANILIRSAVVAGSRVTFHTGGGIVADSDPDREYEETLHKAEGMRLALEAAVRQPV